MGCPGFPGDNSSARRVMLRHMFVLFKMEEQFIKIVDSLLPPTVCDKLIQLFDNDELILVERGTMATYERNIWICEAFAADLYKRILPHLPEGTVRCNEYFRFTKYTPGQEFKLHTDGTNQDKHGNRSKYTVNIFLNAGFCGGETDFYDNEGEVIVHAEPMVGRAVLFDREILHCGNKVLNGTKYLLRSDIMVPAPRPNTQDNKIITVNTEKTSYTLHENYYDD